MSCDVAHLEQVERRERAAAAAVAERAAAARDEPRDVRVGEHILDEAWQLLIYEWLVQRPDPYEARVLSRTSIVLSSTTAWQLLSRGSETRSV